MNIREATDSDVDAIRSIAHNSLSSSYTDFLDEETVDSAVDQWYADESIEADLESEDALIIVAEADGEVIGFTQSELVGEGQDIGQLLWLHVDPEHRGRGTGPRLLVRTREELLDFGADEIRAVVLENNEGGNEFYRNHGFERVGERQIEVGEKTYTENVYTQSDTGADGEWRSLEPVELSDGGTVYVSYGEAERGSDAPFYTAYESEDGTARYGLYCGNCDSLDNAMDSMGQIECNRCGNRRKATRWDSSYL